MTIAPQISLAFDGDCEAAFKYYERVLEGHVRFMLRWGDSPMAADAPPGWGEKILHAAITIGETEIIGLDVPSDRYEAPIGFEIMLNIDDPVAAERVFGQLAENGSIRMPLQQTFWARLYGVLVDRFGIPWSVNCRMPEPQASD